MSSGISRTKHQFTTTEIFAGWFTISLSSHMVTSHSGMITMNKLFNSEYLNKCPTVCPTNLSGKNKLETSFS